MRLKSLLCCCFVLLGAGCFSSTASAYDVIHNTHLGGTGKWGDFNLDCLNCHLFVWNQDLGAYLTEPDWNACNQCHGPDGAFDGMNDPDIGMLNNLPDTFTGPSKIYDADGKLLPRKENWCLGCHDDGISSARGVFAPNIAGKSVTSDWQSPVAVVANGFQGAEFLIDGDLATGNLGDNDPELILDLGTSQDVTHIRFNVVLGQATHWQVYGSNDLENWDRILLGSTFTAGQTNWQVGPAEGWVEYRLDKFDQVRYISMVRLFTQGAIPVNSLVEFEYKADLQYGYLVNGHKISCDNCHDTNTIHVDGVAQTYKFDLNNYTAGYRLSDVLVGSEMVPALEVPRVDCNWQEYPRTDNDFALCFTCHDRYKLLGDATGIGDFYRNPPETNFRNDAKLDAYGNVTNDHFRHLKGRGFCGNSPDWDSDWDGVGDSPQSCMACHNVHGSPAPVMTRHGELTSPAGTLTKVPMFNFQFLDSEGLVDPDLSDVMASTGGKTQFFGGGPGTVEKNNTCRMCHNDQVTYTRTPLGDGEEEVAEPEPEPSSDRVKIKGKKPK